MSCVYIFEESPYFITLTEPGLFGFIFKLIEKHFFQRYFEDESNAKGQVEGRGIFILFHGNDRLTGHTHFFCQVLLRHFVTQKAQLANVVADSTFLHVRSPSDTEPAARCPRRSVPGPRRRSGERT